MDNQQEQQRDLVKVAKFALAFAVLAFICLIGFVSVFWIGPKYQSVVFCLSTAGIITFGGASIAFSVIATEKKEGCI